MQKNQKPNQPCCPVCKQAMRIEGEVSVFEENYLIDTASYVCACNPGQLFVLVSGELQEYGEKDNPRILMTKESGWSVFNEIENTIGE